MPKSWLGRGRRRAFTRHVEQTPTDRSGKIDESDGTLLRTVFPSWLNLLATKTSLRSERKIALVNGVESPMAVMPVADN
jgi:hypothetical protein